MNLKHKAIRLPFKHPFTISKGTKTHQPSLLVELEFMGVKGYGEAPAIGYYHITVEKMISDLEAKRFLIEKTAFTEPERLWHFFHHLYPANPFLVCALDMAVWDIFGKLKNQPLRHLWSNHEDKEFPLTDITIGIDTIENMVAKLKEMPWPVYKIKLGTAHDIEIVKTLRKHTDALLRVDANAAWTADEALEKITAFAALGVELVEQPLAKDDWEGMKILFRQSTIPLFADESCVAEQDVARCKGYFHGINIKLTKCSGITPALRMIANARKLGLKIMVGSMNESSVGTAAIAQLLPLIDYVDMDGPLLLAEDVAEGVSFDYGRVIFKSAPGLGLEIKSF